MMIPTKIQEKKNEGFTLVELIIVIVVIGILAAIILVAYNGVTANAKDTARIAKIKEISKAIELYQATNGYYPKIQDASGNETTCDYHGENWGHCDRNKDLSDALAPYIKIDPTSLSSTAPDAVGSNYYYTSSKDDDYQTYGIMIYLDGDGGKNDGGYYGDAYELGPSVGYCMKKYTGSDRSWKWSTGDEVCIGGN